MEVPTALTVALSGAQLSADIISKKWRLIGASVDSHLRPSINPLERRTRNRHGVPAIFVPFDEVPHCVARAIRAPVRCLEGIAAELVSAQWSGASVRPRTSKAREAHADHLAADAYRRISRFCSRARDMQSVAHNGRSFTCKLSCLQCRCVAPAAIAEVFSIVCTPQRTSLTSSIVAKKEPARLKSTVGINPKVQGGMVIRLYHDPS